MKTERRRKRRSADQNRQEGATTELSLLLSSYSQSVSLDRTADYLRRGRAHAGLADSALLEAWKRSWRALASDPSSLELRGAENDLASEIALRQLEAPWDAVTESTKELASKVREAYEQLTRNPEQYRQVNEDFAYDLADFIINRDKAKH